MSTTTFTPVDALKTILRDRNNNLFSDDEYERLLIEKMARQATYTATRLMPGHWAVQTQPLCLFGASFDEQPGASYTLTCAGTGAVSGVSIRLESGTDVRETIEVVGCAVSFSEVVAGVLRFVADHRAIEYSQAVSGSVTPKTAREELLNQAQLWEGVKAI